MGRGWSAASRCSSEWVRRGDGRTGFGSVRLRCSPKSRRCLWEFVTWWKLSVCHGAHAKWVRFPVREGHWILLGLGLGKWVRLEISHFVPTRSGCVELLQEGLARLTEIAGIPKLDVIDGKEMGCGSESNGYEEKPRLEETPAWIGGSRLAAPLEEDATSVADGIRVGEVVEVAGPTEFRLDTPVLADEVARTAANVETEVGVARDAIDAGSDQDVRLEFIAG